MAESVASAMVKGREARSPVAAGGGERDELEQAVSNAENMLRVAIEEHARRVALRIRTVEEASLVDHL